ncbi:hypothetical protein Tco_0615804 [Tanacetum coccineum]
MIQYLDKTKSLIPGFERFTIRQGSVSDNKKADASVRCIHKLRAPNQSSCVEILKNKSISDDGDIYGNRRAGPNVDDPYHRFIRARARYKLPHETKGPRRIRPRKEIHTSKWCPLSTFVPTTEGSEASDLSGRHCSLPRDSSDFMHNAHQNHARVARALTVWGTLPSLLVYGNEAVIPAEIECQLIVPRSKVQNEGNYDAKFEESHLTRDIRDRANDASPPRKTQESWDPESGRTLRELTEALGKGAYKLREWMRALVARHVEFRNLKKCYLKGSAHWYI